MIVDGSRPWGAPAVAVARNLGVDPERGISATEAGARLARVGANVLPVRARPSRLLLLGRQFTNVLVAVLVVAALVSGFLLSEWLEAAVIGAIIVLNALLGYAQSERAETALAALRELTAPEAMVLRDGVPARVRAADLVPGDVLLLDAGTRVPADARIVEAHRFAIDESPLTGESVPAEKDTHAVDPDAGVADRSGMAYMGTTVTRGRARAVVTGTGRATEIGTIAALTTAQQDEPTPLQRRLAALGRRVVAGAAVVVALVFLVGVLRDFPADEMFLIGVALGVAAIPEALPAAITVTLAQGTQRMATEHALVRNLSAVETVGAADVICTDKTGTLTRNELRVRSVLVADVEGRLHEAQDSVPRGAVVASVCCNDARRDDQHWVGDPVDVALMNCAEGLGVDALALRAAHPRVDEVAFDSTRKRMTTLHTDGAVYLLLVKGAPEVVAERCASVGGCAGLGAAGGAALATALATAEQLAGAGMRTLALASRSLDSRPDDLEAAEHDLVLLAVVALLDELRDEARPAVDEARRAGIRVVMITGDHAATTATIATELGLVSGPAEVMSGAELHDLDDGELARQVAGRGAYARVDPVDKVKLVDAWRARGAVVAMTGDGVNDAPALRRADIGIAMGSGTDVGKDAADIVLADDNFATIVTAVREGRRAFLNLQKLAFFLVAANVAEILVVAVALFAFGDAGPPLLATQILWINLVTDGLPVLALAVDPAPADVMRQQPRGTAELLDRRDQLQLLLRGAALAAATIGVLVYGDSLRDYEWPRVQTLVFTALVLLQLGYAFTVRRIVGTTHLRPARNPWLAWSVAGSVVLQLLVVQTAVGHNLFDTVALSLADWVMLTAVTAATSLLLAVGNRFGARPHR